MRSFGVGQHVVGFALGAARSGLIANSLGINRDPDLETVRTIALW